MHTPLIDPSARAWRRGLVLPAVALLAACGGGERESTPLVVREAAAQTPSTSAFQEAVRATLPAVVYVQVEARPQQQAFSPFGPSLGAQAGPGDGPLLPVGSGSGVIFAEGGYILTNNHVVQEAERVTVTLYDRRQLEAQVVARDPSTDIAVVKIEAENLPVARIGNSDQLTQGQWVLALGSPLGLQFTVTAGIVSATDRSIGILGQAQPGAQPQAGQRSAAPLEDFIQTDAAINPGNSGGPLIDLAGNVVGINSAIASPTGVFAGYGFSVPINLARRVAEQLIRFGEVRRPYLGVSLDPVTAVDVQAYDLPSPNGAEVRRVEQGSPAGRAGVQLGDVVVGVGDQNVQTVNGLQAQLARLDPGTRVNLRVIRYGREVTLPIELGLVRSGVKPRAVEQPAGDEPAQAGFGVGQRGGRVFVTAVRPYSPAARAGIRPGQAIVSANRQAISSVDQLATVIERSRNGVLSLVVDDPQVGQVILNYQLRP
jgi:serine protease Do